MTMKIFNLPDLGEGLPDAEIHEWFVKEGDIVTIDQPIVALETAKAVVDVPSPYSGRIVKLYGNKGDIIKTGEPLIAYEEEEGAAKITKEKFAEDMDEGTVVGKIETTGAVIYEEATGVVLKPGAQTVKTTPAVRQLAKKMNIDLDQIKGSGPQGRITLDDVYNAPLQKLIPPDFVEIKGARRTMAINMAKAHQQVVAATLVEDVDINHWSDNEDFTIRIIRAIVSACHSEPALNAHFDGETLSHRLYKEVNLGIAVDTPDALYVPVLKDAGNQTASQLRKTIDRYKTQAKEHSIPAEDMKNVTITLSNFGTLAGRYANPIVMPPTVAILGVGKSRDEVVSEDNKLVAHRILPLSLTFDHRAVTGGEAARFLAAMIEDLSRKIRH